MADVSTTKVVLSNRKLVIEVGETVNIGVTFVPEDAEDRHILWKTDSTQRVRVDQEGNVTGLRFGETYVNAVLDNGFWQYCHVKVLNSRVKATGVTLPVYDLVLQKGDLYQLIPTILPDDASNKEFQWSFENDGDTTVVTVNRDSGMVMAHNYGTARAIVTTEDGHYQAVCNITVPRPVKVTGVSLNASKIYLSEGATFQLEPTVLPEDATNKSVTWSKTKGSTSARVFTSGLVKAVSPGSTKVYVTTVDGKYRAQCEVIVVKGSTPDTPEEDDETEPIPGGDDAPTPVPDPDSGEGSETNPDDDPDSQDTPTPGPTPSEDEEPSDDVDYIYRIDYDGEHFTPTLLYKGNLGFDTRHPIESVVYYETEEIQKIYWVDGQNPLRFLNFMATEEERANWDDTYFDSNRPAEFSVKVNVSKDNSGNPRPNGVVQYLMTYYNKHGQETGYVWVSDLVYLSPFDHGGTADDTNSNKVTLEFTNLDTSFDHFRVYSVFRSSYDGAVVSYLVGDAETNGGYATVIDDGAHLVAQDASRLMYLGSQPVIASTLTHKDQTLFLGDLLSVGHDYSAIEQAIKNSMYDPATGISTKIVFGYSSGEDNIPYIENESIYPYENQLRYSSSKITTFKGGEKYRFAIKFQLRDGTESPAFWIGDKENHLYPVIDNNTHTIKRAIAKCTLSDEVIEAIKNDDRLEIQTVQLCIAEATYADRSVKAQGILNPTMFNTWDRYNNRIYSVPSWISRPRGSRYANRHFKPVDNATVSTGEISCNWWEQSKGAPRPFYRYKSDGTYDYEYPAMGDYDYIMISYNLILVGAFVEYSLTSMAAILRIKMKPGGDENVARSYLFSTESIPGALETEVEIANTEDCVITCYVTPTFTSRSSAYGVVCDDNHARLADYFKRVLGMTEATDNVVALEQFRNWVGTLNHGIVSVPRAKCFTVEGNQDGFNDWIGCWNNGSSSPSINRWHKSESYIETDGGAYVPSFYTKQYMFVDENVITLNSPEFDYEAVDIDSNDGLKLRVIGAARITAGLSDYTVLASHGKKPGENLVQDRFMWASTFGNPDGLLSWPLWEDRNLDLVTKDEQGHDISEDEIPPVEERTSENYTWGGAERRYWLHMWEKAGNITGYFDPDENEYGYLRQKVFANMKFSYDTVYAQWGKQREYSLDDLRLYNHVSSQYMFVGVAGEKKYYNGNVQMSLLGPNKFKYPIPYSIGVQDVNLPTEAHEQNDAEQAYLYTNEPVSLEYRSTPHAILSLPSGGTGVYNQTVLPYLFNSDKANDVLPQPDSTYSDCKLPWLDQTTFASYSITEEQLDLNGKIAEGDKYVLIGELYQEYPSGGDTRYGGITDAAIQNCRFISAGPQFLLSNMSVGSTNVIIANQGDTYFQRWDCLKTKPYSTGAVNGVIDITSAMVETHINIDGRTDLQRGIDKIASIDAEKFGSLNTVYSQPNNYRIQRDLDDDFNTDVYRSSLTWTLEKHDAEAVDEWTHITLASSLKLDGDKGVCRALRRFNNSIVAFQDRGISEVLFNSRTQLSTTDGVPIEIANSGKVDGKRYISNKYGCTNKWSIAEGKSGLYFVDNINKAFCAIKTSQTGRFGIDSMSEKLGFGVWFKDANQIDPWTPEEFNNIVSFYDKVKSDVYLVRNSDDEMPCLVFNETLGTFTSFYDYRSVPMMVNVEDRFVSYNYHSLWLQNEGLYGDFFGEQKDFWIQYRITPEPYSDKIWTNIDYRADFYEVLNSAGESVIPEEYLINGDKYGSMSDTYKENETFSTYRMWNEYQTTGDVPFRPGNAVRNPVEKKFRIWRLAVPRAVKNDTNRFGLDRIRNPWVNLLFKKTGNDGKNLMQLHDIVVRYFE